MNQLISMLKEVEIENLFNPYTDYCTINDRLSGPEIRTKNLEMYLEATRGAEYILIGEAPGYLGCRRTGIAFTDENHYALLHRLLGFQAGTATYKGKNVEVSAKHVWSAIRHNARKVFLWNIVPFHPHIAHDPLTNRAPTALDFLQTKHIIEYILETREYKQILPIGQIATKHLSSMGYDVTYIRHPSFGGSNIFKKQIEEIMPKPKTSESII